MNHATPRPSRSLLDALAARELVRRGPTLPVVLHATCRDGTQCAPKHGVAMVDTGADRTAVALDTVAGARPVGHFAALGVTGGETRLPTYGVRLSFPGTSLPEVKVPEAAASPHLRDQGLDVLLGRAELDGGRLVYDGRTGQWGMSLAERASASGASFAAPEGAGALDAPSGASSASAVVGVVAVVAAAALAALVLGHRA